MLFCECHHYFCAFLYICKQTGFESDVEEPMRLFVVTDSLLVISRERVDSIAELVDYAVKLLFVLVAQRETEHNFKSVVACSIQANAGLVKSRLIIATDELLDRRVDIHDSHHPSFGGITVEIDLVVRGEVLSGRPFAFSRR